MEGPAIFEVENSPLREAYILLGAKTPLELHERYGVEDQILMKAGAWDYKDEGLVTNKVKSIVEQADSRLMSGDEHSWAQEILWFWYHHAVSCAVKKYKDKAAAQTFVAKALEIQSADPGHPNKITKMLDLLVNDKISEAEEYIQTISEEPEKSTAESLIREYKDGLFF